MEDQIEMDDMLKEVAINNTELEIDLEHLHEMISHSDKGSSQLAYLVKHWEYKQANAVRLLREDMDRLSKQREEMELKRLEILKEHRFEEKCTNLYKVVPRMKHEEDENMPLDHTQSSTTNNNNNQSRLQIDAEFDTIVYWKQRAIMFEEMLDESREREQILLEKLEERIKDMEKLSITTPVEELSQLLKRPDNFIHFILQSAPIVFGHMDKELRY